MLSPAEAPPSAAQAKWFKPAHPPHVRQAARVLYEQGAKVKDIARQLHITEAVVCQWSKRDKWQRPELHVNRPVTLTVEYRHDPKPGSEAVRSSLSQALEAQALELKLAQAKLGDLRNKRDAQGLAAVAKTIAEAAAIVFDWKSDNKPGVLVVSGTAPKPIHVHDVKTKPESMLGPPPPPPDPDPQPL